MTTNTSAGLTRMNIGHYGDGLDVYDADEVEALLADLRGKLADANKRADTYVSIALDRATDLCKADSRIAQLEAELAEARELLREAYDGGTIWRGHRIYNHIKPAAPTADDATHNHGNKS
jgi:hypothetical protein